MDNFDNNTNQNQNNQGYYFCSKEQIIQDAQPDGQAYRPAQPTYNNSNNFVPPPIQNQPRRKGVSVGVVILSAVLAAVIGAVSALGVGLRFFANSSDEKTQSDNNAPHSNVNITVEETVSSTAQAVSQKAGNSVVGIRTVTSVMSFFGGSSDKTGEGSGVIYSSDGYIVTNYHVIEEAVSAGESSKIEVFLGSKDNESYEAKVVGYNISYDLAVLKIDADNLPAAERGDSSEIQVGQYVVTIGAPGGLEFMGSVTYGIISGLDRVISAGSEVSLIQTDAAINPGNSGGALLDANGRLIGINSAKIVSEEFEGMGFAIPINTVVEKCDKIISRQNRPEAYTGITISETYTSDVLAYYGFPSGAVVLRVDAESPADAAGIKRGDIITEFDGKAIKEYTQLAEYISDCEPGQKVGVKLYRNGREYSTKMEIGANS